MSVDKWDKQESIPVGCVPYDHAVARLSSEPVSVRSIVNRQTPVKA